MGDIGGGLAQLITGLAGVATQGIGGALTPGDQERHVYKAKEGGRLDEAQAQYTAEGMRNQLAAAIGREQPQERIAYDVPRVAGPGIRSGSAQGFMPFQGRYQGLGGVSLNALGPRGYGGGGPRTIPTWDPTGNGNGKKKKEEYDDPLNTVPPWGEQGTEGEGEDSQTVGIVDDRGDEQQQNQDLVNRENQDKVNTILKNINDGGKDDNYVYDPNTGEKAGDLADYNKQVWEEHETWSDTPSQAERWDWAGNYTGYNPGGQFSWGSQPEWGTSGGPHNPASFFHDPSITPAGSAAKFSDQGKYLGLGGSFKPQKTNLGGPGG